MPSDTPTTTSSLVLKVDAQKLTVDQKWKTCEKKTACMLIDRENLRLFVGCRSRVMTVMNIETGQVITMLLVGDHVDATAHDPATKLILNSNAEGTATVIRRETPDKYSMLETVKRCRKQKPWRSILRPTSCTCLQANIVSSKCWF